MKVMLDGVKEGQLIIIEFEGLVFKHLILFGEEVYSFEI